MEHMCVRILCCKLSIRILTRLGGTALHLSWCFFFFSSRRRHTRSVSAFLLNRSSDLHSFPTRRTLFHVLVGCGLLMLKVSRLRSEERRVGKECRSRWGPYQ